MCGDLPVDEFLKGSFVLSLITKHFVGIDLSDFSTDKSLSATNLILILLCQQQKHQWEAKHASNLSFQRVTEKFHLICAYKDARDIAYWNMTFNLIFFPDFLDHIFFYIFQKQNQSIKYIHTYVCTYSNVI